MFGDAFNASFVCPPQIVLCLLVREITFAPDLPQPQCGKVFRRIPALRLLLSGFFVQHPLHHAAVFGAAYALLPAGTITAVFLCSQVSFLVQIAKKMLFRHQLLQRQKSHFQLLAPVSFQHMPQPRFSLIVPYSQRKIEILEFVNSTVSLHPFSKGMEPVSSGLFFHLHLSISMMDELSDEIRWL